MTTIEVKNGVKLGGKLAGFGLLRDDGQLALVNEEGGHTLLLLQSNSSEEIGVTAYKLDSGSASVQLYGMFSNFVNEDNTHGEFNPYWGIHGTWATGGVTQDNNPLNVWMSNAIRVCGPSTGTLSFNNPPPPGWFEVYTQTRSRNGIVVGPNHAYSIGGGVGYSGEGAIRSCAVDGTGNPTHSCAMGWSTGGGIAFIQSYNYATSSFEPISIYGTQVRVGQGCLVLENSHTPVSATDTGATGQLGWDANFLYICVASNAWKRVALSTW